MNENALKNLMESLGLLKKQGREINTKEFKVRENTLYYSYDGINETALQISNISHIDIGPAPKEKISGGLIAVLLVGISLLFLKQVLFGLIMVTVAVLLIYFIVKRNERAGENLIIHLNNGRYFLFNFAYRPALSEVRDVLLDCINHNNIGEKIINITGNQVASSIYGSNYNINRNFPNSIITESTIGDNNVVTRGDGNIVVTENDGVVAAGEGSTVYYNGKGEINWKRVETEWCKVLRDLPVDGDVFKKSSEAYQYILKRDKNKLAELIGAFSQSFISGLFANTASPFLIDFIKSLI